MRGHPPEHEIDIWGECMEDGCDCGAEDAYWNKVDAGLIDAAADASAYSRIEPREW